MFSIASLGGLAGSALGEIIEGGVQPAIKAAVTRILPLNTTGNFNVIVPPDEDPFYNDVVLHTHLDAATPVDQSKQGHTLTVGAGATRDTTNKKFGASSFDLSGGTSDTRYIEAPNHPDFDFAGGDWTIEFWVRFDNVPQATSDYDFISRWTAAGGNDNAFFCWLENRNLKFTYATTNTNFNTRVFGDWTTVTNNQWYHLAWCRSGNNLRCFIDGTQFGATEDMTGVVIWNSSRQTRIGERINGGAFIDGQIDEVRITKGTARYTSNFTPSSTAFADLEGVTFGIPKAIIMIGTYGNAQHMIGSIGASDGTNQWCCANDAEDNLGTTDTHRLGRTDEIAIQLNLAANTACEYNFVQFINNGATLNVGKTDGNVRQLIAILLGGNELIAKAGTAALTNASTTTVTPGFQTNALIVANNHEGFDGVVYDTRVQDLGFGSYDGSTIRQCCANFSSADAAAVGDPNATVDDDKILAANAAAWTVALENITSTQFDLTVSGADLSAHEVGYLALNVGSGKAWAGVLDSPVDVGSRVYTEPGFKPVLGLTMPNMISAVDTDRNNSEAGSLAYSAFSENDEWTYCWTDQDAADPSNTSTVVTRQAIDLNNHAQAAAFDAVFSQFTASGVELNFSVVDTTVRKWPALFLGDGLEMTWILHDTWDHGVDGDSASADFVGLAGAQDILIVAEDVTKQTTGILNLHLSTDNGSTYRSTSGDYEQVAEDGQVSNVTTAASLHSTNATAARSGSAILYGANIDGTPKTIEALNNAASNRIAQFIQSTSPVNACQVVPSGGGNLTGGKIYCFKRA